MFLSLQYLQPVWHIRMCFFGQGSRQYFFPLRPRVALNQFKVQALDVVPTQTCVLFTWKKFSFYFLMHLVHNDEN